jgi:hypothetical protein
MAQKRREESEFKVSDKRLFTSEGELRDSSEEQASSSPVSRRSRRPPAASGPAIAAPPSPAIPEAAPGTGAAPESDIPEPPTASEQQAQHDAYKVVA